MTAVIEIVSTDEDVRRAAARAFTDVPAEWSVRLRDEASGDADVVVADGPVRDGAVQFDPDHPEEAVRKVAARLRPRARLARTILVAGAAGGAGATTLALHLAAVWGSGACVADLAGGAAAKMGLPPDSRTWLPNDDDVSGAALPVAGGFRILCAPCPVPAAVHFPLRAARSSFERLVIDAGTSPDLEDVVAKSDAGVLVVPPTRPGAEAARALLETHTAVRWAVVANRTGPGGQIMRRGLEGVLGRALTLELPCCPALRDAEDEGNLVDARWHRWTRAVARLARALDAC
ncbi:MAG TPA: hypothetical protein VG318_14435 [Actinomycetota bacterium]|nr:hypothetical protein [Actinomycetota bacterium]